MEYSLFENLPEELLYILIIDYFTPLTVLRLSCVNKYYRDFCDESIWRKICQKKIVIFKEPELSYITLVHKSWLWLAKALSLTEIPETDGIYYGEKMYKIPHGFGIKIYSENRGLYVGTWNRGKMHGHGIWYIQEPGRIDMYVGHFFMNKRNGSGTYKWLHDGQVELYSGCWNCDTQEGYGVYEWACGDKYEGEWSECKRSGFGAYYSKNGIYIGSWVNGVRHGSGQFFWPDGSRYNGQWYCGVRDQEGVMYWTDGWKYDGFWNDDDRMCNVFINSHGNVIMDNTPRPYDNFFML